MDSRTLEYLKGRFGDHYRRSDVPPPEAANEREWGYIPWSKGTTTMVRHNSFLDLAGGGSLGEFLSTERPRHVYFSAGQYDHPGADGMEQKGWRGSDLVFDLDADHLPGVDPEADSYREMLAVCKDALLRLLDLLETDFAFRDVTVVFSGSRGYHVHVRDPGVLELGRRARREIVEYVLGANLEFDDVLGGETVAGTAGRSSPARKRTLPDGGWASKTNDRLNEFLDELLELDEDEAMDRLQSFRGIGSGKASAVLTSARANREAIREGNVDVHPAVYSLAGSLFKSVVEERSAPIDEPVTTDINRLIRLPGSLHGGSGLEVVPLDRDAVSNFDPLVDAVPNSFVGNDITISVTEESVVELRGETFRLSAGLNTVPEYVGVFAMARGRAEKARE